MKNILALAAGALGCLLLALYAAETRRPAIEKDLSDRANNAVAPVGLTELALSTDGREVTLRGEAPDEQTKRDAGNAVGKTYGVHAVRNLLEIRAANATAVAQPGTRNTTEGSLCQQEFSATLGREQIQFQPSWYGIQPASFPLLERLVASANKCPGTRIEISGHTDPTGRLENNLALSKARAQEVANYLIAHGITAARLSVVGHGPNRPVADNSTAEGMQKNRRIDFNVIAP